MYRPCMYRRLLKNVCSFPFSLLAFFIMGKSVHPKLTSMTSVGSAGYNDITNKGKEHNIGLLSVWKQSSVTVALLYMHVALTPWHSERLMKWLNSPLFTVWAVFNHTQRKGSCCSLEHLLPQVVWPQDKWVKGERKSHSIFLHLSGLIFALWEP